METAAIKALLEKYWQAETTVEEEQILAAYFKSPEVDAGLRPYADLFAYFEEESRISPGPDFESRILQAVTPVRYFHSGIIAAAATVLIAIAGLFLFQPAKPTRNPGAVAKTTGSQATGNSATGSQATTNAAAALISDTYDDPEQALAAVRHALLIASVHLNEGRKQISNK
jgi:hypothetical protein